MTVDYPDWLEADLRSDHAGETGAVWIYRGVLRFSRDAGVRAFAKHHLDTERRHLAVMDRVLSPARRSRLLPVWRLAAYLLGALPALVGPQAVYATIDAVENFVDGHYHDQIVKLAPHVEWHTLKTTLEECREDELAHRDEARALHGASPGLLLGLGQRTIAVGSAAAVWAARRF